MYVTLKRGDQLPSVALAQARLLEWGADLVVDGLFGELTERAVVAFQTKTGIPVTKFVDHETWATLIQAHPMSVIDAIDAGDVAVWQEDTPYVSDGHSQVWVTGGMSRGARDLIQHLVAANPARSVALLRLHGHGGPGHMGVTSGKHATLGTAFASEHFANQEVISSYVALGSIMKPYGSIELHGCNIASRGRGRDGRDLLAGMAQFCRVPVTAGVHSQLGGKQASRFEGPVITRFPAEQDLVTWAHRVLNACQW
jgi:hypothetical protein